MHIIVDFDNTIVNTNKAIWKLYRKDTGDYSTHYTQQSSWWYDDICPLWGREKQREAFGRDELFEYLEFMPKAKETLLRLALDGHTITVCTVHEGKYMSKKADWIDRNLDFVHNVIVLGLGGKSGKSMIQGDVILDDSVANLKSSLCKHKICFGDFGWNKEWTGMRVRTFDEFYEVIRSLTAEEKTVSDEAVQEFVHKTISHINDVKEYLNIMAADLLYRGINHDKSKLFDPELRIYARHVESLKAKYGTEEYNEFLSVLSEALDHHYKANRHHPEHFENGIDDMTLLDVMEMLCDWMATSKRNDTDMFKDIEISRKRFGIDAQLCAILKNTLAYLMEKLA